MYMYLTWPLSLLYVLCRYNTLIQLICGMQVFFLYYMKFSVKSWQKTRVFSKDMKCRKCRIIYIIIIIIQLQQYIIIWKNNYKFYLWMHKLKNSYLKSKFRFNTAKFCKVPETKGSLWRSQLFRKHALKGVQNLDLILNLWSIESHMSHMWEGITNSLSRSRRPFLPSYQLINIFLTPGCQG